MAKRKKKISNDAAHLRELREEVAANHLVSLADISVEIEREKDGSLKNLAERIMECVTILSVAYLTPSQAIFSLFPSEDQFGFWQRLVLFCYLVICLPLLGALLLSLKSLMLNDGVELLQSPAVLKDWLHGELDKFDNSGEILGPLNYADSYCDAMQQLYSAFDDKHNKMNSLLHISKILVFFSVFMAIVFSIGLFVSVF